MAVPLRLGTRTRVYTRPILSTSPLSVYHMHLRVCVCIFAVASVWRATVLRPNTRYLTSVSLRVALSVCVLSAFCLSCSLGVFYSVSCCLLFLLPFFFFIIWIFPQLLFICPYQFLFIYLLFFYVYICLHICAGQIVLLQAIFIKN